MSVTFKRSRLLHCMEISAQQNDCLTKKTESCNLLHISDDIPQFTTKCEILIRGDGAKTQDLGTGRQFESLDVFRVT